MMEQDFIDDNHEYHDEDNFPLQESEEEQVEIDFDEIKFEYTSFEHDGVSERKPGVMFNKKRFTELVTLTRDNNIKKSEKEKVWYTICTEFYFPLVRHVMSKLKIAHGYIDPWVVVTKLWEKTDKFDLTRNTSPLAYFWQIAFREIATLNTHSNGYSIRAADIRIKQTITKIELDNLYLDSDYRILSVKAKDNGQIVVVYQSIDPVVYDVDNIQDEWVNYTDKISFIDCDKYKKYIAKNSPTEYISILALKFYKYLLFDKITSNTDTALWKDFIVKHNNKERISKINRIIIIDTLKKASEEYEKYE